MKNKKSAEFLLNYSWEGKTKGKYSGMDLDS